MKSIRASSEGGESTTWGVGVILSLTRVDVSGMPTVCGTVSNSVLVVTYDSCMATLGT